MGAVVSGDLIVGHFHRLPVSPDSSQKRPQAFGGVGARIDTEFRADQRGAITPHDSAQRVIEKGETTVEIGFEVSFFDIFKNGAVFLLASTECRFGLLALFDFFQKLTIGFQEIDRSLLDELLQAFPIFGKFVFRFFRSLITRREPVIF